ncbi:hypothetical protein ACFVYA_21090 [Amycolatopsis sp. NPDC058278]|uniref:hypothetical protein n=1 Tax=Amycolatopsis sp. NPDC058278 TaxID=3346417 RepID=UPI0036DE72D1
MEIPKRLTPLGDVTRRLYLASGNRCAYLGCEQALMSTEEVLVGEIAHIEGALPNSARFNLKMSNETRRGYDNLLLLCGTHHTTIDRDVERWTVATLEELKRYTGRQAWNRRATGTSGQRQRRRCPRTLRIRLSSRSRTSSPRSRFERRGQPATAGLVCSLWPA